MPNDGILHYEIAKVYALMNDSENAIQNLKRSIEITYNYIKFTSTEPEFASLRDNEEFKNLLGSYYR